MKRRLITAIMVGLLVVGGIYSLYALVVCPKVGIDAPAGSVVTITDVSSGNHVLQQKVTGSNLVIPVSPGYYAISVRSGTHSQLFYDTAALLQTHTYTLSGPPELYSSFTVGHPAYVVVPNDAGISYLDTTLRTIVGLGQDGTILSLDSAQPLSQISEDTPGRAQTIGTILGNQAIVVSNNNVYVLHAGQLTPLQTDATPSPATAISLATNPAQNSFIVALDQTLYFYASPDSPPVKIATMQKRFDQLAFGGNQLLVYSTRMPTAVQDIKALYGGYAVDPIVVNVQSKKQLTLPIGPIVDASVSPDGRLATVEAQNASHSTLYSLATNASLYTIINPDITTPLWTDNTHFTYGKNGVLWRFDTTLRRGTAIGTLPGGSLATSITYNATDGTYYATTYDSAQTAAIYHFTNTTTNNTADAAQLLAAQPQTNSQFTLSYLNVSRPTVVVTTTVNSNNPTLDEFRAATLQARQAALDYLQASGIDSAGLAITYDPASF